MSDLKASPTPVTSAKNASVTKVCRSRAASKATLDNLARQRAQGEKSKQLLQRPMQQQTQPVQQQSLNDATATRQAAINANINPAGAVWVMSTSRALALSLMYNTLGQRDFPEMEMPLVEPRSSIQTS